ncbi:MAG: beta-galactosidase [bacterium]|nr:beta-galactosidase [bacterium]MDD5756674.1 beta-galactosidase [bacterium]
MPNPSPKIATNPQIIQQWQAFGKLKPELLADGIYEEVKKYGITSLQSYVYWSAIEPVKDSFDFTVYDEVVEKIKAHKLKWVPFIILGPNYSIPEWFSDSSQSVYAKCIEHGQECDIQSIWNPYLMDYVERFIRLIAERYNKNEVIESVLIGISGVWGEAIYPSSDGINRRGHKHSGWWCNDQYARQDFISYCTELYGTIDNLNKNWGTEYSSLADIDWPIKRINLMKDLGCKGVRKLWHKLLASDHPVSQQLEQWYETRLANRDLKNPLVRNHHLAFVKWYIQAMTLYAGKWLQVAKQHFPGTPVYLVTGGYGDVITGADFSAQARICGKFKAGVRITNLNSDYAASFAHKSLLSTAAKYYGADIQTEETIETAPDEVAMRIFDYASGGIKGLYFKTLFGIDYGTRVSCTGKSDNCLPLGRPSAVACNLVKNLPPEVAGARKAETALLLNNDSIALSPQSLDLNLALAKELRKKMDLDIIDEKLVQDSILQQYRFLINYQNPYGHSLTQEKIADWIKSGGIYLEVGSPAGFEPLEKGYKIKINPGTIMDFTAGLGIYVFNKGRRYPWPGLGLYGESEQDIYIMQAGRKILMLNDSNKKGEITIMYQGKKFNCFTIAPKSLFSVALERDLNA